MFVVSEPNHWHVRFAPRALELTRTYLPPSHTHRRRSQMAAKGASLQNYNSELVRCITDL